MLIIKFPLANVWASRDGAVLLSVCFVLFFVAFENFSLLLRGSTCSEWGLIVSTPIHLLECWCRVCWMFCAAPHVPDPFQTLADIYDAKGYTDKRMQVCFCDCLVFSSAFISSNLSHCGQCFANWWCSFHTDMEGLLRLLWIAMKCWFQCQLIVAHLKQTDAEDWYALGQEFQEMNNIEQALFCYDRGGCNLYCLPESSATFLFHLLLCSQLLV